MTDVKQSCLHQHVGRGIVVACTAWGRPSLTAISSGAVAIHNGFNHQPTQSELRASHRQDVTPDEAREIDHLYDQLLSGSEKVLR
jgi:hypothetical protein